MGSQKPGLLKLIIGRICATWAIIVFVSTMLVMLVPFFLFSHFAADPTRARRFVKYSRVWMGIFLPLIGCPLRVRGREHFEKNETYIVICNHNSFMDIPISTPSIPGANKTIAKIELAKVPVFGAMYTAGSVLVDRKSETSRKESVSKMKKVLEQGMHMCIYPEGSRNTTDAPLKPFHDGAFRLALTTKKSLLPALMFNTRATLPREPSFYLIPHKLEVHFLPAIPVQPNDTVETLKQRAFSVMENYYQAKAKTI